jgi:hypothetical protein
MMVVMMIMDYGDGDDICRCFPSLSLLLRQFMWYRHCWTDPSGDQCVRLPENYSCMIWSLLSSSPSSTIIVIIIHYTIIYYHHLLSYHLLSSSSIIIITIIIIIYCMMYKL